MSYITKTYLEIQFKNFAEKIKSLLNNKVDKVEGKGLSTNDLTSNLKNNYDTAYNHSQSAHARTDATKVESSTTNGNIKINGTETTVYTHPSGTNPHGTTKSDVGLGNVPNVATNDQTPSYTEATSLTKLKSGEKLSVAFGKISKAITDLISHIGDNVKHITSEERTNWNVAKTHANSAHAPSNAQANVIETVKVNGTALTPTSKSVNITVPTNVSDLTNDSGYTTNKGTITGIKMNGASKGTSGVVDLGTVLTEHQDISGKSNVGHKHTKSEITDFPTSMTPTAHNQASNTINAMTGYSKPTSTSAISASDTLNTAIGKLEKALDSKGSSSFSGSYNDLSDKPTIPTVGNGTITIKQGGTSKGTFTMNQSVNATIELTDNNTWRGIQDNLTSDSTTDSLSAAQGKALKALVDGKLPHFTLTSDTDFNTIQTTGVYHVDFINGANQPEAHHGTLFVEFTVGTPYQIWVSDSTNTAYKRNYSSNKWTNWYQLKLTDTVTTATTTGSGNAVTEITASNGALTVTKGSTFLTAHPTITTSTDSTSTDSPSYGGTFTTVDSVTKDSNGHVTKINTKTITLPSVDDELSSTSTNPVQNKIINTALSAKADYEEGTWTPCNDYNGSIDTSVYEFTNATYTRIGNTVILYAKAEAKVPSTKAELCVFTGSFPYPYRCNKLLNLIAINIYGSTEIGKFNLPQQGKISFGNFTFAIESGGLTDVGISIIYNFV